MTELRILLIEDWNVNCTARNVVARLSLLICSTGEILAPLKIERINFRPQKKECEFCFVLGTAEAVAPKAKGKGKAVVEAVAPVKPPDGGDCLAAAEELQRILGVPATPAQLQDVLAVLAGLKNCSYGKGFLAGRSSPSVYGTKY